MSLLIDIRQPAWMQEDDLRDNLRPLLPDVEIFCGVDDGDLRDVTMLAASRLHPGVIEKLPSLRLIQRLGAGVEAILTSPDLPPDVRVARLTAKGAAEEIAQYSLAYVMAGQRNMAAHRKNASDQVWEQIPPRVPGKTTVAVLGLGQIGAMTATLFAQVGFRVLGWSRSQKSLDAVECRSGAAALPRLLSEADYAVAVLPSTTETRDLFDADLFAAMKPGSTLINVGRGDLIVDKDLLAALDRGSLGHAVLDVFRTEPLPPDHPYWYHDRVTVTPHVSGWRIDDALPDIAENYTRLTLGQPLLNEVDRATGY